MGLLENPLFKFGEYVLFVAVIFHALNGIRLVVAELGLMLGKPKRPVYPFKPAMFRQRVLTITLMVLAAVFIIYGWFDFFLFN